MKYSVKIKKSKITIKKNKKILIKQYTPNLPHLSIHKKWKITTKKYNNTYIIIDTIHIQINKLKTIYLIFTSNDRCFITTDTQSIPI